MGILNTKINRFLSNRKLLLDKIKNEMKMKKNTISNILPENFQIDNSLVSKLELSNLNKNNDLAVEFPYTFKDTNMT